MKSKFTFAQLEEEFTLTSEEELRSIKGGYSGGYTYNPFAPSGDWVSKSFYDSIYGTGTSSYSSNSGSSNNSWNTLINSIASGNLSNVPAGTYRNNGDGSLIYTTPTNGSAYGFGVTTAGTYSVDIKTGKTTYVSNELVKTDQYGHKFYSYDGGKTWCNIQDITVSAKMKDPSNIVSIQDNTKNTVFVNDRNYTVGTTSSGYSGYSGYSFPNQSVPKLMAYSSFDDTSVEWTLITPDVGLVGQVSSMRVNNNTNVVLDTKTGLYSTNINLSITPPFSYTNPSVGANVDILLNGVKIGSYSLNPPTGQTITEKGTMQLTGTFNLPVGTTGGTLEFRLNAGSTENLFEGRNNVRKSTSYTLKF